MLHLIIFLNIFRQFFVVYKKNAEVAKNLDRYRSEIILLDHSNNYVGN